MTDDKNNDNKIIMWLLTGDIGGTNSRMSIYDAMKDPDGKSPLSVITYRNQDYLKEKRDGIFEQNIIAPFIKQTWTIEQEKSGNTLSLKNLTIVSCLAIAGPVRNNSVWMSNLHNIIIDGTAISNGTYGNGDPFLERITTCKIINDFVAQGYGCLTLQPEEVKELTPNPKVAFPKPDANGPKVCVGAGTGLGECYLTPSNSGDDDSGGDYSCFPSEGGHVEYAPRNETEYKLWNYLRKKFNYQNRISVERIVSGPGLANCYEFLSNEYPDKVNKIIHDEFVTAGDMKGKVVAENAAKLDGSLCHEAMNIMMTAYGSEVGSAAIKFIPTGGMYVTGGLTPKNIQFIHSTTGDSPFLKAYYDKGRVTPILDTIPLYAVLVEDLGIRGAHYNAKMVRLLLRIYVWFVCLFVS